jgi:uncharacterized protein (DUF58 family)
MPSTRIIARHRLLLISLVFTLFVLSVIDEYAGWRFLLFGLASAWALSRFWAQQLARNLRLQREMRFGWAQVGDRLEERLTLTNESALPAIWVQIRDHSDLPGYSIDQVRAADSTSRTTWRSSGQCNRRGLFTLGPTSLLTSDPLGLYRIELHDPRSVQLMVTPPVVPLPRIQVAPGGMVGEGRPRPNAPERTVSASGVREFYPGDPLRLVHWRTTARRQQLYVRTFDNTPLGDWWLILDSYRDVQAGEGMRSTAEHGVILAASLADRGLRLGRAVGLSSGTEPFIWLPPRQGDGQRWAILRTLAVLEPGERALAGLLLGLSPSLGRNSSLVLITPDVRGEWLEALLPLIWRGLAPTVLLLDPASFAVPARNDQTGGARGLALELARHGISHQVITPDLLDRPEARPGKEGAWRWRVTPSGRAIADEPSLTAPWRSL